MSKLDDILTNLEFQAIVQHDESTGVEIRSEAKLQVKDLMLELIGDDTDLTPLMPLPSIAQRASGSNQAKDEMRRKVEEL